LRLNPGEFAPQRLGAVAQISCHIRIPGLSAFIGDMVTKW